MWTAARIGGLARLGDELDLDFIQRTALQLRHATITDDLVRSDLSCTVITTTLDKDELLGSNHAHLVALFSDGVKWIVRLPFRHGNNPPQAVDNSILESEVATHHVFASCPGLKLPQPGDSVPSFMLMEHLQGKNTMYDGLEDDRYRSKIIGQIADEIIVMSSVPFQLVGSPWPTRDGGVEIGPITGYNMLGGEGFTIDSDESLITRLGPYTSMRECYSDRIKQVLFEIESGYRDVGREIEAYVVHLEALHVLLPLLYPESEDWDKAPFFLPNTDNRGDQWLVDSKYNITGSLDWE